MFIGENALFVLSLMLDDGEISFEKDRLFSTLADCVEEVKRIISNVIETKYNDDKDMIVPSEEDIYNSLYADKYLCYIIGERDDEYRMVFHISKISVGNNIELTEMSFCQH